MAETTITNLPNAAALTGTERVPMDQGGTTVDATTAAIAALAAATDLSYDPATQLLSSSTGDDVTLPLVSTTAAGLVPPGWLTGEEAATLEHIHGNIAGEVYEHVKAGASLSALTPYRIIGGVGDTDRVEVVAADAGNGSTMPASGILPGALANNADGHGTVAGVITGVNTAAYPPGTVLYVAVGGGLTATRPSANVQMVAVVGRQHASTGTVVPLIGPSLALSAYTGAYGDLIGRPTLGSAAAASATDFAPAAQGVSNGNNHDHSGGDGAQIAYSSLLGLPGNFTDSAAGLVPASGGGTTNFLRADGTFAAPPSGGGGTPSGTSGQAQFNNAGAFGGAAGLTIDPTTGRLTLASFLAAASAPATPASAGFVLYAAPTTGALSWRGANGFIRTLNATGNTADRAYQLQDKSGTIAHLDDVFGGFSGYQAGKWITPVPGIFAAGNSLTANAIQALPFEVKRQIRISGMGARITTAVAAGNLQLAIYNSTSDGIINDPISNTASIGTGTAQFVSDAAITSFLLLPGRLYWWAISSDVAVAMQAVQSSNSNFIQLVGADAAVASSSATVTITAYSFAGTFGTWPNLSAASPTAIVNNRNAFPYLFISAFV